MLEPTDSFGSYLRYLRRRVRLTQTELSIAVGYSPGQISMLENGQRLPDITAVSALFLTALHLENDRRAAVQLIELAQAAVQQKQSAVPKNAAIAVGAQSPTMASVHQRVTIQREELGILEDIPPLPTAFMPRPAPLQRLSEWLQRERRVAICGLPGMGKSTLAAAFAHSYSQEHPVFWMTFAPALYDSPTALLQQLALFLVVNTADPAPFSALLGSNPSHDLPVSWRNQLFTIGAGLHELRAPLLIFDDAHHLLGDTQLHAMVQRLTTLSPYARLLWISREELNLPGLPHLTLGGLENAEAARLVNHLSPTLQLAESRDLPCQTQIITPIEALLAQTAGNPLLLRLAVSQLEQQSYLSASAVGAALAVNLVEASLAGLLPKERLLLDFLAIVRTPMDLTDAHLPGLLAEEIAGYAHAAALSALQRRRLIDHASHATPHPLLREPLLMALNANPARQQVLHRLAAQWALFHNDLLTAAHHFCAAADLRSACDLLAEQGELLNSGGKTAAAVAVVEEVLTLARTGRQQPGIEEIIRKMLIVRGDLLVNTVRAAEGQASYAEAMGMTTQRLERAQLAERLAISLFQTGQAQDALELCEEAISSLIFELSAEGMRLRLQFGATRMRALVALARFDEAAQLCQQAINAAKLLRLIKPGTAEQIRASASMGLGYLARMQGRLAESHQQLERSVQYARKGKHRSLEAEGLAYLSAALRDLGDFTGAEAAGVAGLTIAQELGNEYLASNLLHYLSITNYYHNELALALTRSEQALAPKRQMGDGEGIIGCHILQALVYSAWAGVEEAAKLIERARLDCQLYDNPWLHGLTLYVAGIVASYQPNPVAAERYLLQALALEGFTNDRVSGDSAQTYLGIVYVALGKLDLAETIANRFVPDEKRIEHTLLLGLLRGMLAIGRGEPAMAQAIAAQTRQQAQATGFTIYAREAQRLHQAAQNPPPLSELPRLVCCEKQG